MCFHRRLVFGCAHYAWLGITQPCKIEAAFDRGETDTGCDVKWSHGYDTIRVQTKCLACIQAQEGTNFRLGIVKEQLKVLKEHLALIKGEQLGSVQKAKEEEKDGCGLDAEPRNDGQSAATKETGANATPASPPGSSGENAATPLEEGWLEEHVNLLDEIMEEVRVDPKHRSLKLPSIVAARKYRKEGH